MRMWFRSKKTRALEQSAHSIYHATVSQSRAPHLYADLQVPDTLDGRFDALVLHLGLVLARLAELGRDTDETEKRRADILAREISSLFVAQMDDVVREMGIGDLSVGKHVKRMSKALYGRTLAYHAVLSGEGDETLDDALDDALDQALLRNVWAGSMPEDATRVAAMSDYTRHLWDGLKAMTLDDLMAGKMPEQFTLASSIGESPNDD